MGANVQVTPLGPQESTSPDLPPTSPGGGGKLRATSPRGRVSAPRRSPPGGGQQADPEGRSTSPKDSGEVESWCIKCADHTQRTADEITTGPHLVIHHRKHDTYLYLHDCGTTWVVWRPAGGAE